MTRPGIEDQITFLYTADLEETARFYEEIMGFDLALDQGTCRIYRVCGRACLGFCRRPEVPADLSNVIFTLVTSEVDAWYAHLSALGVDFENPPQENPKYRIYHCFLRDPNGYLIEIQEFRDPRWGRGGKDVDECG